MTIKSIVEKYYQAFNEKRFDDLLGLLTDDVIHEVNEGPTQNGKEAFRKFLAAMNTHYDERLGGFSILADQETQRASAEFICEGRYLKTAEGLPEARGQSYRLNVGAFFAFKAGKISRVTNYYNLTEWLKQVQ